MCAWIQSAPCPILFSSILGQKTSEQSLSLTHPAECRGALDVVLSMAKHNLYQYLWSHFIHCTMSLCIRSDIHLVFYQALIICRNFPSAVCSLDLAGFLLSHHSGVIYTRIWRLRPYLHAWASLCNFCDTSVSRALTFLLPYRGLSPKKVFCNQTITARRKSSCLWTI